MGNFLILRLRPSGWFVTVAALWPEALTDTHRLLATQTLEALDGRWESVGDEDPLDRWRLQYLVTHVDLAGDEALQQQLVEEKAIEWAFARLGKLASHHAHYAAATGYRSLELAIAQRLVQQQDTPRPANNLAGVYLNRGNACGDGQDLRGALADFGQAIALMDALRQRLGPEWPPGWADALARAYMKRGIVLKDSDCLEDAIFDWDRAAQL